MAGPTDSFPRRFPALQRMSNPSTPTPAAWALLGRLFADPDAAFRHHMSLARCSAAEFYRPTAEADSIRSDKQAILASDTAEKYLLESPEGRPAFDEFAALFCPVPLGDETGADQAGRVRALTLALEPDWLLLLAPDWRLASAGVCFPTRWSLEGKRLQPLPQIHGIVPDLQRQIGRQIDVFFQRVSPGEGWGRANWGLSTTAQRNQHPSLPYEPIRDDTPLSTLYVRVESQNLCKLPNSDAMAFGIRILSFPLSEVMEHPEIVTGLKQQLRTMPEAVARYKGIPVDLWQRL